MADIELMIKIPESRYRLLQKQARINLGREKLDEFAEAVLNGTPLPKGHGRLIDADDIALIDEQFYVASDYYVAESAIGDAPTIIEADMESEEQA